MGAAITDYSADLGDSAFMEEQVPDRLLPDTNVFSFADDTIDGHFAQPQSAFLYP